MKRDLQRYFINKELLEMYERFDLFFCGDGFSRGKKPDFPISEIEKATKNRVKGDKLFIKQQFDYEYDQEIDNAIGERLVFTDA